MQNNCPFGVHGPSFCAIIAPFEHSVPAATEPIYVYEVLSSALVMHCEKEVGLLHAKRPGLQRPVMRVGAAEEVGVFDVVEVVEEVLVGFVIASAENVVGVVRMDIDVELANIVVVLG